MSARDELADVLKSSGIPAGESYAGADAILAAGYRKPRTITSVEELEAMPPLSVIRDSHGRVFERWVLSGWQVAGRFLTHHAPALPATVLREPGAGA